MLSIKMLIRAHVLVSGRVQGVFFRDHTQRWATSLGLTGWVRNLMDGRVEVMVEGAEERIQSLIKKLDEGPPMAYVQDVSVDWLDHQGEFSDFRVTY